jgi:hypothetical protein
MEETTISWKLGIYFWIRDLSRDDRIDIFWFHGFIVRIKNKEDVGMR